MKLSTIVLVTITSGVFIACNRTSVSEPNMVFFWETLTNSHRQEVGVQMETRAVMTPEFHNNITGEAGRFQNSEQFVPGPSPLADKIAARQGIATVNIFKHSMRVLYRDGCLTEEILAQEVSYLQQTMQRELGRKVMMTRDDGLTSVINSQGCSVWQAPFGCQFHTLYVPKDRKSNLARLRELPGIEGPMTMRMGAGKALEESTRAVCILGRNSNLSWNLYSDVDRHTHHAHVDILGVRFLYLCIRRCIRR